MDGQQMEGSQALPEIMSFGRESSPFASADLPDETERDSLPSRGRRESRPGETGFLLKISGERRSLPRDLIRVSLWRDLCYFRKELFSCERSSAYYGGIVAQETESQIEDLFER